MSRRDYRHREPKKSKKEAKKSPLVSVIPTPLDVEVVKKAKKREKDEGEA